MNLKMGLLNGKYFEYYPNNQLKEIRSYHNGMFHGTWITWNEKGIKIGEANYRNNQKHGKWYIWDENGTKRYEMEYKNGKKTGTWYQWDMNGNLINTKKF